MKLKSREAVLIAIATILVIVLIVGFVRDRNTALLKRTAPFDYTSDMSIVEMDKHGMLLNRSAYEAKIRVGSEDPYDLILEIYDNTDVDAEALSFDDLNQNYLYYEEYESFKKTILRNYDLVPEPDADTRIWAYGAEYKGHDLYLILDIEGSNAGSEDHLDGGDVYLYVYYTR